MGRSARKHAKSSTSSSEISSTDSSSLDSAVAEQYLAGFVNPRRLGRTVRTKKVQAKEPRRRLFARSSRGPRLKNLDEETAADTDESSETSERYEVIAQLVRRRPRTRLPYIPPDSESNSELSDSVDSKFVLLIPDTLGTLGTLYPAQAEPSRKQRLKGFLDLLLGLSDSSSSER